MRNRTDRLQREGHDRGTTAGGRWAAARRGATVLVFVMAILGVLFVTGLAFMATMNFEAEIIEAERSRELTRPSVRSLIDDFGDVLEDSLPAEAGVDLTDKAFSAFGMQFAEMPGVHNSFSPVEPYETGTAFGDPVMVFPWFTDLEALAQGPLAKSQALYRQILVDTTWTSGVDPPGSFSDEFPNLTPVDADGDGIVDSMQVALSLLGVNEAKRSKLSLAVNPPTKPTGEVYLGLRVLPHGGMVDVNHAHPTLVQNVLEEDPANFVLLHDPPYPPLSEERSLRRRFLLPPRVLSPTGLQGSPVSEDPLAGGGDYSHRLFWQDVGDDLWNHRYWPFAPDELNDAVDPQRPIWAVRMDPTTGSAFAGLDHYDRRHLITTVSHDDLLRRDTLTTIIDPNVVNSGDNNIAPKDVDGDGVLDFGTVDVFERMVEVNRRHYLAAGTCDPAVVLPPPFEYVNYPQDLSNRWNRPPDPNFAGEEFNWCACALEPETCTFEPRKGRLRVSLPGLEEAVKSGLISNLQLIGTIRDAFTLLLLNSRADAWGAHLPAGVDGGACCLPDGSCSVTADWECTAPGAVFTPDLDALRDDAAWSFFDPAGFDKIAETAASLTANLIDFMDQDDVPTQVEVRQADFRNLNTFGQRYNVNNPLLPRKFVYGLERQPFITEIAAIVDSDNDPITLGDDAYAVELFNPYGAEAGYLDDIPAGEYYLRVGALGLPIALDKPIERELFTVFKYDPNGILVSSDPGNGQIYPIQSPSVLVFQPGDIVYLVRQHSYPPNPEAPAFTVPVDIVVDQFEVPLPPIFDDTLPGVLQSVQRPGVTITDGFQTSPWLAPIPADPNATASETLGNENPFDPAASPRPIEVLFANVADLSAGDPCFRSMNAAYPTTGSLLLLMRHANTIDRSFTTFLRDDLELSGDMMVDTGRMPVFDLGMRHHQELEEDPTRTAVPNVNKNEPGGLMHLPWGQLVFDYFTALPRANQDPYAVIDPATECINRNQPEVDLGGLRVHGRINLNAAPWKVLAGLPLMPRDAFRAYPGRLRTKIENYAVLAAPLPDEVVPIGDALAKAIVSYREARSIDGNTGEYGGPDPLNPNGRGWTADTPKFRRGTGFMTVGELANVRHAQAFIDPANQPVAGFTQYSYYRTDAGLNGSGAEDYVGSIALLVALGDWVTVRSHVFTLYGTLRGEMDDDIEDADAAKQLELRLEDVDRRALRFQETIDRLPTFLGEPAPLRIGDRVIAAYNDVLDD